VIVRVGVGIVAPYIQAHVIHLQVRGMVAVRELYLGHVRDQCMRSATVFFGEREWRIGGVMRRTPVTDPDGRTRTVWLDASAMQSIWEQSDREAAAAAALALAAGGSDYAESTARASLASGELSLGLLDGLRSPGSSRASVVSLPPSP